MIGFSLQISSLQVPTGYADSAFVPNRGWTIFGGHAGYNQTQTLQSIDGIWTMGEPLFANDVDICIVQVLKIQENPLYFKSNSDAVKPVYNKQRLIKS